MTATISSCVRDCGPGQLQPSARQLIGEQRAGADPGQIPFVNRLFGEGRVRAAHDVTGADLGAPRVEGVDGEEGCPQAHPLQAASDGGVLDLLILVPAKAGRLLGQAVVDVHRRQGHHPLHPPLPGKREQFDGGVPDGAWVEEQGGDALQEGGDRVGP
jgi:hypothetical protein